MQLFLKIHAHTKTCTQILTEVVCIIDPNWKQPRCPSTGERIIKLWYIIQWSIFQWWKEANYQALKRKRDLKSILLSEWSPPKKAIFCTILIILGKKNGKYSKGRKPSDYQEGAEWVKCGGILGWNHSAWYSNCIYTTLCLCQNPQMFPA